jgi:transposase
MDGSAGRRRAPTNGGVGLLEWKGLYLLRRRVDYREEARPEASNYRCPANFLVIVSSSPFTVKWRARHSTVIAAQAGQALHVLDRFHITSHLNQAVDQVRRAESTRLRSKSKKAAQRLKHMRWPLLRRGSRVRGRVRQKLKALLASKLATARAWELKEIFSSFWKYKSVIWAGGFLDYWCFRAMRSRLEPMKKVARMLRTHESLILNWFRAKGEISNGAVEGLNNKIRVVTRRSYGFRTYDAMEIALYHNLGRLPEPESAHRFC